MSSIVLDMCFDEPTLEEAIITIETMYSLKLEVVKENGPAGGWPEIKFIGDKDEIIRLLDESYGMSDEHSVLDRGEMIDSIED